MILCVEGRSRKNLRGEKVQPETSGFQLLREHVAAERDSPVESYRRKVRTVPALGVGPGENRRNQAGDGGAHHAQQTEVGADGLDPVAVLGTIRAKLQKLDDARLADAAISERQ
jgi:hypothetical protein